MRAVNAGPAALPRPGPVAVGHGFTALSVRRDRGEADVDVQAAVRPGPRRDGGVVGGGDGAGIPLFGKPPAALRTFTLTASTVLDSGAAFMTYKRQSQ